MCVAMWCVFWCVYMWCSLIAQGCAILYHVCGGGTCEICVCAPPWGLGWHVRGSSRCIVIIITVATCEVGVVCLYGEVNTCEVDNATLHNISMCIYFFAIWPNGRCAIVIKSHKQSCKQEATIAVKRHLKDTKCTAGTRVMESNSSIENAPITHKPLLP